MILGHDDESHSGVKRSAARAANGTRWYSFADMREDRRLTDEIRMRLALLQELYRQHAVESAKGDGEIVYRNALPPEGWINDRLQTLGLDWRVGACEGGHCTFVDRHCLPLSGLISRKGREKTNARSGRAITA